MKRKFARILNTILAVFCISLILFLTGFETTYAENMDMSKAVFFVGCYDVGWSVLKDLKGVKGVERGFLRGKEINTVYYDPEMITVEEMKTALTKAGTYLGMEE